MSPAYLSGSPTQGREDPLEEAEALLRAFGALAGRLAQRSGIERRSKA